MKKVVVVTKVGPFVKSRPDVYTVPSCGTCGASSFTTPVAVVRRGYRVPPPTGGGLPGFMGLNEAPTYACEACAPKDELHTLDLQGVLW